MNGTRRCLYLRLWWLAARSLVSSEHLEKAGSLHADCSASESDHRQAPVASHSICGLLGNSEDHGDLRDGDAWSVPKLVEGEWFGAGHISSIEYLSA